MSRHIPDTPVLKGKDAIRFMQKVLEGQLNPDPRRIKFIREAEKIDFDALMRKKDRRRG